MQISKLVLFALFLAVSACSSGSQNTPTNPATPASTWLSILVPEAAASGEASGYRIEVSISGVGLIAETKVANHQGSTTFQNLTPGEYVITVYARLGSTELARTVKTTTVSTTPKSETVNISIPRTSLSINVSEQTDYSTIGGQYRGQVRTTPYCFQNDFLSGFGYANATTSVSMSGGELNISADIFSGLMIEFTGNYVDTGSSVTATGTYRSSDFKQGTWSLNAISQPKDGILFLNLVTAGDCTSEIDLIGVKAA